MPDQMRPDAEGLGPNVRGCPRHGTGGQTTGDLLGELTASAVVDPPTASKPVRSQHLRLVQSVPETPLESDEDVEFVHLQEKVRSRAQAQARAQPWLHVRSALLGFAAGAAFWHLVGFWSFIDRVLFKGETGGAPAGKSQAQADAHAQPLGKFVHGLAPQTGLSLQPTIGATDADAAANACSSLEIDRLNGQTHQQLCRTPPMIILAYGLQPLTDASGGRPRGAPH